MNEEERAWKAFEEAWQEECRVQSLIDEVFATTDPREAESVLREYFGLLEKATKAFGIALDAWAAALKKRPRPWLAPATRNSGEY